MNNLENLVPRDKFDFERANAAIAAGYPVVAPILPQLLVWIQDMNWPIADPLAAFFATIGAPLAPYMRVIFETDDAIWKSWIVTKVVAESPDLARVLHPDLQQIASLPAIAGDWALLSANDEDNEIFKETVREFLLEKNL